MSDRSMPEPSRTGSADAWSRIPWRIHVIGSLSVVAGGAIYSLYRILTWRDADQAAQVRAAATTPLDTHGWPWVSVTLVPVEMIAVAGAALLVVAWLRHRRHASEMIDIAVQVQKELQSRFADLFRFASEAVFLLDEEGLIIEANQQAERIYGFTHAELLSMNVTALRAPDVRLNVVPEMEYCRERGNLRRETIHVRRDGTRFPVEFSATAIHVNGRLMYQDIVRDIGEQKRGEERVQQANEQMTRLVAQLEESNRQNGVLSEMREFLLACATLGEIGPVVARSLNVLLPNLQGAIFLLSPSRTDLEMAARWGGYPTALDDTLFAPDACWALRRGMAHVVEDAHAGLVCPHLRHASPHGYACLPLMARGEVLGLLHVRYPGDADSGDATKTLAIVRELASTVTEVLSLSIWNIRLRESLSDQAIRDSLTGLYNRAFMEDALQREIYRAGRSRGQVGVIMVDVDRFKRFNDTYGHEAGDLVLAELATLLKWRLRKGDVVCRYGGEEFVLVLPDSNQHDTVERASQLRESIRGLRLSYGGHDLGTVAVSMGVAVYPESGSKCADLMRAVDVALYQAKQQGRDRVVVFDRNGAEPDGGDASAGVAA